MVFSPLNVSVLKTPATFTLKTLLLPNVSNVVLHINPTHRLFKVPQYAHIAVVNNHTITFYCIMKRFHIFFNQEQV